MALAPSASGTDAPYRCRRANSRQAWKPDRGSEASAPRSPKPQCAVDVSRDTVRADRRTPTLDSVTRAPTRRARCQ